MSVEETARTGNNSLQMLLNQEYVTENRFLHPDRGENHQFLHMCKKLNEGKI